MKKFARAVTAGSGLAAAAIGLAASVTAAPTGSRSAQDTVDSLQAQGYDVVLNRVGQAPMDQCTVVEVRPGQDITERRTDSTDSGSRSVDTVVHRSVYVFLSC